MENKNIISALTTFAEAYELCCKPICRELGMPQMAFDILMFLSDNPNHYTARDISRIRGFQENIISVNVNKLVTEGYLERRSVEGDRRKVRLQCTEKAAEIIRRGHKIQECFLREMHRSLTEEEIKVHIHCLETVAENAKRMLENNAT